MDIKKQPGIQCQNVIVTKLKFDRKPELPSEKAAMEIQFNSKKKFVDDDNQLLYFLEATVIIKDETTTFLTYSSEHVGYFGVEKSEQNMELKKFSEFNAPAVILPYIRETLSSITLKSGMKPIFLPPINIIAMLQKNQEKAPAVGQ